jgi:hypothetical protein
LDGRALDPSGAFTVLLAPIEELPLLQPQLALCLCGSVLRDSRGSWALRSLDEDGPNVFPSVKW